jgi:hypothetical protein
LLEDLVIIKLACRSYCFSLSSAEFAQPLSVIVIAYKPGRLGNRLIQAAHFIPFALDSDVTIVNLSLDEYADLFVGPSRDLLCRFPPQNSRLPRNRLLRHALYRLAHRLAGLLARLDRVGLVATVLRLDWSEEMYLDREFAVKARRRQPLLVQGWRFQNPAGVIAHAATIREYFTLRPQDREVVDCHLRAARHGRQVLVGLHIRRSDYRGTKYFYSHAEYAAVVRQIAALWANQTVRFLICSDETIPPGTIDSADVVAGPGGMLTDMYALAGCDLIAGPPSTYSAWASFYGSVPLYWIEDPEREVTPSDFVVHDTLVRRPIP